MSVRARFHLLIFVVFPVGALILSALGMTLDRGFTFAAFGYTIVIGLWALLVTCPSCSARLVWQGYLLFPFLPRHCRRCGHDLTRKTREANGAEGCRRE